MTMTRNFSKNYWRQICRVKQHFTAFSGPHVNVFLLFHGSMLQFFIWNVQSLCHHVRLLASSANISSLELATYHFAYRNSMYYEYHTISSGLQRRSILWDCCVGSGEIALTVAVRSLFSCFMLPLLSCLISRCRFCLRCLTPSWRRKLWQCWMTR